MTTVSGATEKCSLQQAQTELDERQVSILFYLCLQPTAFSNALLPFARKAQNPHKPRQCRLQQSCRGIVSEELAQVIFLDEGRTRTQFGVGLQRVQTPELNVYYKSLKLYENTIKFNGTNPPNLNTHSLEFVLATSTCSLLPVSY